MIAKLSGILVERYPPYILVDVAGIGYEVDTPMSTFCVLPENGEAVVLYTHFILRDAAPLLYGFATRLEQHAFRLLIKVVGVGPKIALAILSGLSVNELALAVERGDVACLARIPGIGKKTAERLALELRGKLSTAPQASMLPQRHIVTTRRDIHQALLALGYSEREVNGAIASLSEDVDINSGIRLALSCLMAR